MERIKIWEILVNECGANPQHHGMFDASWPCDEYRFQGSLGFGGKLNQRSNGSLYVSCYSEDETEERLATIQRANKLLQGKEVAPSK